LIWLHNLSPQLYFKYSRTEIQQNRNIAEQPGLTRESETTTLAGARSIQRALQRRGQHVQGIYERINLHARPSLGQDTQEPMVLVCGKLDWEWDSEQLVLNWPNFSGFCELDSGYSAAFRALRA
jgi:hypothetical protein